MNTGRRYPYSRRLRGLLQLLFWAVLIPSGAVLAADDPYLDALKAEIGSTPTVSYAKHDLVDEGARTDDQSQMEAWLKENWGGSYAFYSRLNDAQKREIHRLYLSGASITDIREKINELFKNR